MEIQYKGSRWFKCDLHLHTPASKCFLDKKVTAAQWVEACLAAGLNCVAVTDHNTGAWIDCVKEAAKDTALTVFPGVEITCDTSKIHLLLVFDTEKSSQNIEDFLITCGISREMFASAEAHSPKTVAEIARMANEAGALVIPAHIDEFSGLAYEASKASLKEFIEMPFIHAVQFVHPEYLDSKLQVRNNQELLQAINTFYGKTTPEIGENDIKNGYDGLQMAKQARMRLLTFSDNPDSTNPSKHGLSGIGLHYSWVKMDGKPSLEGFRQAFMMPDRTLHCFESATAPYKMPRLWIQRISISNTTLTKNAESFSVDFNPQLTTIIGGRGSGKSSILRFFRGVFRKEKDLEDLDEVLSEYKQFFKKVDENGMGVLKEDTHIEVFLVRDGLSYRINYNHSTRSSSVERMNPVTGLYELVEDDSFIDFFQFEEYSQKQIFSIAQKPNSLRNRIDSAIEDFDVLISQYRQERQEYKGLMENSRSLQQAIQSKGRLITTLNDLKGKIELLKQSGIAAIITNQQSFLKQKQHIKEYLEEVKSLIERVQSFYPQFETFEPFTSHVVSEQYREEVVRILGSSTEAINQTGSQLKAKTSELAQLHRSTVEKLKASKLYQDSTVCKEQFETTKAELEKKGVTDMTDFEKYNQQIVQTESELKQILAKEEELKTINEQIEAKKKRIAQLRTEISYKRREFVDSKINSDKIKITIRPYFDKADFKSKFRKIVQKPSGYEDGVEKAMNAVYADNNVLTNLEQFKASMHSLHDETLASNPYDGWFSRLIRELTPSQLDAIDLLYPEDQIEMKYKGRDGNFKSLSVASAGQKTTAILTFILSFGDVPLILDQPEDDLDNRLVYDLIVDKIRQIKETRQVIIVTHNANIPVNGDAEYVVSLSSDSHNLKIQAEGTVESDLVKSEICEVMEGGVEAFRTRAKRYATINK